MSLSRDFKGIWIPREIWLHPTLSLQAKVLWAEIDWLNNREKGGCFATDEYLMKFLGVKSSRLHEVMKELRDLGLLEKISFDGRERVMKAKHPEIDDGGMEPSGKAEPSIPENRNPDLRDSGNLPIYRGTTLGTSSSPIPLQEKKVGTKVPKKKFSKEFPDEIRDVAEALIAEVLKAKPNYAVPKDLESVMTHVDYMLRLDGRDPHKIIDILRWALADDFWRSNMFRPNVAKYLREKYDTFEEKMIIKPKQKDRRFAASSDNERAKKIMDDFSKGAI